MQHAAFSAFVKEIMATV